MTRTPVLGAPGGLSDPSGNLFRVHPWREFRNHPHWDLVWAMLPVDQMGITDFDTRTITLGSRLLQAERRCTIAHELEHIRRGPLPADLVLAAREEALIEATVARQLIRIRELGEALAWARNLSEAADELWVDVPTLQARLDHLHPAERHYLRRRLEAVDGHARHQEPAGCCPAPGVGCPRCEYWNQCPEVGPDDPPGHR